MQALERAPPPKVEEMQSSVAKSVDSFAKEAEKLSPFTMIGEQTKVPTTVTDSAVQLLTIILTTSMHGTEYAFYGHTGQVYVVAADVA